MAQAAQRAAGQLLRSSRSQCRQCCRPLRRLYSSSSAAVPIEYQPRDQTTSDPSSSRGKPRQYGQPQPHSHPHLFHAFDSTLPFPELFPTATPPPSYDYHASLANENGSQQLTPGIPRFEYERRRRALMDQLEDGAVVLVMGGRIKYMSGAIFYRFRQASNFWYLTGFQEPDAAVVFHKQASSSRGYKMTVFVPPHDAGNEAWNGPRTGPDGAVDVFGADDALEMDPEGRSLLNYLKAVLPGATKIYHDPALPPTIPRKTRASGTSIGSSTSTSNPSLLDYLSPGSPSPLDLFSKKSDFDTIIRHLSDAKKCEPLSTIMDKHRLVKSPFELRLMRKSGKIAALAHNSTMRFSNSPYATTEWALQSHFDYISSLLGANRMAYVPVVANAHRGCVIHYTDNDHELDKRRVSDDDAASSSSPARLGQLVTMDAGVEYAGYTSDITRAWPVAGVDGNPAAPVRFTAPQRDLYTALLRVLKQCTRLATQDQGYSMGALHRRSVELLKVELRDLGIDLRGGELERVIYPHYLSHHLGLDLHDVPSNARTNPLPLGSTITIEPGLYIPPLHSTSHRLSSFIPDHFRGIGMRVEDDVVVGRDAKDGPVVLTAEAVKEVEDVEAVCSGFFEGSSGSGVEAFDLDEAVKREMAQRGSPMM